MGNERLLDELRALVVERDRAQFHTPENRAIKAGEPLQRFQRSAGGASVIVLNELANIPAYYPFVADLLRPDQNTTVRENLAVARNKYHGEQGRGEASDERNVANCKRRLWCTFARSR